MRKLLLILLLSSNTFLNAQNILFELVSMMDGKHQLESGNKVDIWGYGWDTNSPYITLPAPLLEIQEGDSVTIRFRNISPEAHTIHLHGLDVSQANDGVPNTSFYVWNGDTAYYSFNANYSGTYLYHCHVTTTLHLTMGMYGMILVNRADSTLFDGGPKYDRQYKFLTSDIDTSLSPVSPPPFNEITPNYFMINGERGSMLLDDTVTINQDDKIALRLANVAYAKTRYIFPESVTAEVFTSDGRKLPQSFITDTLEVYPGERFTVILSADQFVDDVIKVEYYNMVSNDLKYINEIKLNVNYTPVFETSSEVKNQIYPNPFNDVFRVKNHESGVYKIYNSNLKLIKEAQLDKNNTIEIDNNYSKGLYFLVTPSGNSLKLLKH